MQISIKEKVRSSNAKLRALLASSRETLSGRHNFGPEDISAISSALQEIAPLLPDARAMCTSEADMRAELADYTRNLEDLKGTLEQVRFMLLARHAHLEAARGQVETLNLWAAALRQTR